MQAVNFHIEPLSIGNLFDSLLGGFGATAASQVISQAGNTALLPCVYTFSKDYDFSQPYMPSTNESESVRLDSSFQPDPPEGWFGLGNSSGIQPPILALDYFQTAPWFNLAFEAGINESDVRSLGSRDKARSVANPLGAISVLGLAGGNNTGNSSNGISSGLMSTIDNAIGGILATSAAESGWDGILRNFDPMLFFNVSVNRTTYRNYLNHSISSNQSYQQLLSVSDLTATGFNLSGLQPIAWFNDTSLETDDDLDNLISNNILTTIHQLTAINASTVRLAYWNSAILRFPSVAAAIQAVSNMPWGNVRFTNVQNGSYAYMIQAGTDVRLENVASYPTEGLRKMAFQAMLSKAICTPFLLLILMVVRSSASNVTITPVYQVMPRYISTKIEVPASLLSARILFPFGISFFIPLFVYTLTLEKESRIFIMMKVPPSTTFLTKR